MPLTDAQVTQAFELAGLPQQGAAVVGRGLTDPSGPVLETFDLAALKDALNARLAALSAGQEAELLAILSAWAAVADLPEAQVTGGAGGGVLLDAEARRRALRRRLSDLVGFAVPDGGFAREAERRARAHRLVR
jgi:hypothetical protein